MACKRSAVRSRLAPPRFALRATRGAATQEPEGRSVVPGEASWRRRAGEDQAESPCNSPIGLRVAQPRKSLKGEAWCPAKPLGEDGLERIKRNRLAIRLSGYAWRSHARA